MTEIHRSTPRDISFELNPSPHALSSVIVNFGQTRVFITVSMEEKLPPFLEGRGEGWVTAEYSLLPGSTMPRSRRERSKVSGRTQEIQRLIGRSLRAIVDRKKMGTIALTVDCDVLVADGGTRTASISGAALALRLAFKKLQDMGKVKADPMRGQLAAISVGLTKDQRVIADLNYKEDSSCEVDFNVVLTDKNEIVEVQGASEGEPFSFETLHQILDCSKEALKHVFKAQAEAFDRG